MDFLYHYQGGSMSEIERRGRREIDPYAPPLPSSWREAREENSLYYRAATRAYNGGELTKLIVHQAKKVLAEAEDLGPAGDMLVQSYIYGAAALRDGYMS
jgi:hypothetical protein